MKHLLLSVSISFLIILSSHVLYAQQPMRYREFELGSDLATIAKLTGVAESEAKLVHERPAMMRDLEWRPRYFSRGVAPQTDPAELIVFRFYNDQLFKVVVEYDRHRTEGMTEADMLEGITAVYGTPLKQLPRAARLPGMEYGAPDQPVAIWGDAQHSITLVRVAYPQSFKLIIALTRLDGLARTATTEAARLDAKEAPQREIARQKKEADDARMAREKAQIENKAVFRP